MRHIEVGGSNLSSGWDDIGFIICSTAWVISRVFETHVLNHFTPSCSLLAALGAAAAVIKYVDKNSGSERVRPQNRMIARTSGEADQEISSTTVEGAIESLPR